jgi:hypothetical protein
VLAYGAAHEPDWAGAFIDQENGGVLVVQFAGNFDTHRKAILAHVHPGAPLELRQVQWSLAQLQGFARRVVGDEEWFKTIPAFLYGFGPDVAANRVSIQISSVVPDATSQIENHYGWSSDIVKVVSDGTGALLLETGLLRVTARDTTGRPVSGLACVAVPDLSGAYEPRPVPMPMTDADGVCDLVLPATGYWIRLERGGGPPELVAIGRAVVIEDRAMEVVVTVPAGG